MHGSARQGCLGVEHDLRTDAGKQFVGASKRMSCANHVRQRQQRIGRIRWLVLPDVETGTAQASRLERFEQRGLIDQATTPDVDEIGR